MGSSFKSFIGMKDFKLWDGLSRTFNRLTSTGGQFSMNKVGHFVDVLEVYGSGDTYTGTTLQTAVSAVGSNACIFLLTPGTWTISANLTIPANVTLYVPHGVTISVSTGVTLTINGPIMAGSYQIFDGAGTIAGTPILLWKDAAWFSGTITDSTTPTYKNVTGGAVTATSVSTDTISEQSAAAGVTIDGVKLKDSQPYCDVINEKTSDTGVTIDGVKLRDDTVYANTMSEKSGGVGVTIDGCLIRDGYAAQALSATSAAALAAGAIEIKAKVVEIGVWNMDTTASVSISHGIAPQSSIRGIFVMIRDDADSFTPIPLTPGFITTAAEVEGFFYCDGSGHVVLNRKTGGTFDSANYDSGAGFNRGWITITYVG